MIVAHMKGKMWTQTCAKEGFHVNMKAEIRLMNLQVKELGRQKVVTKPPESRGEA